MIWMVAVSVLWVAAHSLNRWVLLLDQASAGERFAYWTSAKLIAWLLPTWLLLRQYGHASLRWLGLATSKGLGIAVLWSVLWVAVQETGCRLQLPLFSRPPADLGWYALAGSLLVAPCFEEVMFRGAMLRTMKEAGFARGLTVACSALAFAALHVPGWIFRRGLDPALGLAFLSVWVLGTAAGFLAWRVPSLWGPIVLHWANNFWSTGALAWIYGS
jgi:membrane protease YdiL (CAAX protease family)